MGYYKDEFMNFLQEDYEYIAQREQFWLEAEEEMAYQKLKKDPLFAPFSQKKQKIERKQPKYISKYKVVKNNFKKTKK